MKTIFFLALFIALYGYASEAMAYLNYPDAPLGGLSQGLWHGAISCMTLPVSVWFPEAVHVYNPLNNGFSYNFGFFALAILESEITIPVLVISWALRVIYWILFLGMGVRLSFPSHS